MASQLRDPIPRQSMDRSPMAPRAAETLAISSQKALKHRCHSSPHRSDGLRRETPLSSSASLRPIPAPIASS
jgi:hypothetical protein